MALNSNPFATRSYGAQAAGVDAGLRAYMLGIYNYMASALALTGIVALFAANSPAFMQAIYVMEGDRLTGMRPLGWLVALAPLAMVLWLSFGIRGMRLGTAQAVFWAYAGAMGLSLASLFYLYTGASIARVFFITAGMFGGMSLYGYATKRDLSGWGSFLMMGLIGLLLASLVNIFLASSALYFATSVIGVLIFVGLIAYDTQKIKAVYYQMAGDAGAAAKFSIIGALELYLDFINLFISLLRLMGDRR